MVADVRTEHSFCRICGLSCPVLVEIHDGLPAIMTGDRANEMSGGYTCGKGRAHVELYRHPSRNLHSSKRMPDGTYRKIPVEQAMDEIAAKLRRILDEHGPRAIATYFGTAIATSMPTASFLFAFESAIGTPMRFNPNTIDKAGKSISRAMLGSWMAPTISFDDPKVGLFVGLNPLISGQGLPNENPGKWLSDAVSNGFKLIVIDPRRTETARRAFVHLQPPPGHDAEVLAGMLRVVIGEGLYDESFVADNVAGLDELRRAVEPFTPTMVEQRTGVPADDLVLAARTYATGGRGYAFVGTGPNFATTGTRAEYLTLCLLTLCGYYLREGDRVLNPRTWGPALQPKAQATPPRPAHSFTDEKMHARGLPNSAAGLAVAALADEILWDGEDRVRAFICQGGNPVAAFPDQERVVTAMKALELSVQIDPWPSATAQVAEYVIATKFGFELPGVDFVADHDLAWGTAGYSRVESYAQYAPALVDAPPGSDLIDDWELYFGVAKRMGIDLVLSSALSFPLSEPIALDMNRTYTTDEVLEMLTRGARANLDEVKQHPAGMRVVEPQVFVAPKDEGWTGRLDVGNADIMRDLREIAAREPTQAPDGYDLRLVSRRVTHMVNSSNNHEASNRGRWHNPAFIHPADLDARGVAPGDLVRISTARASIVGQAQPDENLRRGLVSMTGCYGGVTGDDESYWEHGSNTGRLVDLDGPWDPYSNQPLMGNIPVKVERMAPGSP